MSFIENLIDYVINGNCSKNSFKWYLLSGHLFNAVLQADEHNRANFVSLAEWIHHRAPEACYGCAEAVEAWIKVGGLRGTGGETAVAIWRASLTQ